MINSNQGKRNKHERMIFMKNNFKSVLLGILILIATQITPKLVIYAIIAFMVTRFVKMMMSIINEC